MARIDDDSCPTAADAARPGVSQPVALTPEALKRRRQRNVAIGLAVGFLVVLFYAVTIVKLGPGVLNRPL